MSQRDRVFRTLKIARAAGLLTIALVALAGAPEDVVAYECYDYVYECENNVDDCVAAIDESCPQPGECVGEKQCRPQFQYSECFGYQYIIMCELEEET